MAAGVPLTTASDAHRLADVADRSAELADMLAALGVDRLRAYRGREAHEVAVGVGRNGRVGPGLPC